MCDAHGGATRAEKGRAAVRDELASWGLDSPTVDPGETLLALISQGAARVGLYSALLQAAYEAERAGAADTELPAGVRALIGHRYAATMAGDRVEVGEAIRGLAELEQAERKLLADWCVRAVAAGIEQRRLDAMVALGGQLAASMRALVEAAIGAGVPERYRAVLLAQAGVALRQIEGEGPRP